MNDDFITELKELQESVKLSSEHTRGQLENIETNTIIASIISLIASIGISIQFDLIAYWIPASFLLFVVWIIFGIVQHNAKKSSKEKNYIIELDNFLSNENLLDSFFDYVSKLMITMLTGLSIIYATNLIIMLLFPELIGNIMSLNIIPFIASLLWICTPFYFEDILKPFFNMAKSILPFGFDTNEKNSISKPNDIITNQRLTLFLPILAVLTMILSLCSLILTWRYVESIPLLAIVLLLQFIFIILSTSYFSSIAAKKELTNSLTNYTIVNNRINNLNYLNEDRKIKRKDFEDIKNLFLQAKPYELVIDDTFKIVNIYSLVPQEFFIREV